MKIALINPQTDNELMREIYGYHENLGLGLILAYLKMNNCDTTIFDLRVQKLSEKEISKIICENNYNIVGFSVNYATFKSAIIIAQLIKCRNSKCTIIFGGEHVTYLDRDIIERYECVDYIVRGEGEESFLKLVQAIDKNEPIQNVQGISYRNINGAYIKNENRQPISNLDKLPFASKEIVNYAIQNGIMIEIGILAQRGCPFKCSFCNAYSYFSNEFEQKNIRIRSPKNVVNEMEELAIVFENNHKLILHFYDATFITKSNISRQWIDEFCTLIEEKGIHIPFDVFIRTDSFDFTTDINLINRLKVCGLIGTYIGLEAGDDEVLELYNKKVNTNDSKNAIMELRELGIDGSTNGVICFHQAVKLHEVKHTVNFLYSIGFCSLWNISSKAETLPGIKLEEQMKLNGRKTLWDVENYEFFDAKVKLLYSIVENLKTNYFVAQYEDGLVRRLRDNIKLKIFYEEDLEQIIKIKGSLERDIRNIQSITYAFFMDAINLIENNENITPENYSKEIKTYVRKLNLALSNLNMEYSDYLLK